MSAPNESLPALPVRRTVWQTMAALAVLALLVYGQSLGNAFVRWDDGLLITDNPIVQQISPWSIGKAFSTYDPELYIPVTFLSYQLDWQLGGGEPWIFHVTSLLLHTLSACLLLVIAYLLSRRWWAAALVAGIFLLHPLNAEAVAWASGRKDVLSTCFWLVSLLWYLQYRDGDDRKYWWSIAAFALGLMAKATVISLPIALLLVDWVRRRPADRSLWTDKLPYLGLSVVFGIVAIFGKAEITRSSTLAEKVAMAGKSLAFYVQQLLWPHDLSALYPYKAAITLASPDFFVPWLVIIGLTLVCIALLWKSRLPLFGWTLFLLGTAPTLINFAKGGDIYFASDRYAYLGEIGLLLALALLLANLVPGDEDDPLPQGRWRLALPGLGIILCLVYGAFAYSQSLVWHSTKSLFTQVIKTYGDAADVAHTNIGVELSMAGDDAGALPEFQAALKIRETAKPWAAIGDIARHERRFADAHAAYTKALALEPKSPETHLGLGLLLSDEGQLDAAEAEYREGLKYQPQSVRGLVNLASLLLHKGQPDETIALLKKAVTINPKLSEAYYNLGVAYGSINQLEDARAAYRSALRTDPADVATHLNLAAVENNLGNVEEAKRQLRIVLSIDPNNGIARNALSQIGG